MYGLGPDKPRHTHAQGLGQGRCWSSDDTVEGLGLSVLKPPLRAETQDVECQTDVQNR